MNDTQKCLLCYQKLEDKSSHYHSTCSRKFFGRSQAPDLPYHLSDLGQLAKKIVRSSVTVPGVQAKLSLYLAERGNQATRLTLVGLWGNYILKPPVQRYPQMPEIEDLTMHLAKFFQIETVPHGLIRLQSGELAYITRRIDRVSKGQKLHMEDMCQLTGRLTEDKYKGSMDQVGRAILKCSSNPGLDVLRFFELALFSYLTGNADMHLKNFSLIHDHKNMITLTPAYDMLSTRLLISEQDDPEELALTLNGKKSRFKMEDFITFSRTIGLNEKQLNNSLNRFSRGVMAAIQFIDRSFLNSANKEAFKILIRNRVDRLGLIKV